MAIQLTIRGTDKTKAIDRKSLVINNILTSQVDSCKFTIRKRMRDGTEFVPAVGNEVIVTDGGTRIFGGVILTITQKADSYKYILFDIECSDYTRLLDRYLINDSFQEKTVKNIIDSILADKGLDSSFNTDNVDGDAGLVVNFLAWKYEPISKVLTDLADLFNYSWYVDYNKNIYFTSKILTDAPFDLSDDDGSYIFESLKIRRDNSQVRNVIYVRGGEYLGNTFTTEFISDGQQNVYPLPYRYDELKVNVTGEVWNGGIDGQDDLTQTDYIWNSEEKFFRFRGDRIPNDTSSIRVSGPPYLRVLTKISDQASIATMATAEGSDLGEYEYAIVDKSIDTKGGARQRAYAEIKSYGTTITEAEFQTYTSGLSAGQKITIASDAHGINTSYVINRVKRQMWTENEMIYTVSLVTTKTFGIIDFMRQLLNNKSKDIVVNELEVIDVVESQSESISIEETDFTSSIDHNRQLEESTIGETTTAQSLNYETQFVFGEYIWSGEGSGDKKRQFLFGGSSLG